MKKNEIIRVKCNHLTADGYGKCNIDDYIIFVKGLLVNEIAEIIILKIKNNIVFGKIKNIIVKSPARNEEICSVYGKCGGCNLQHLKYDEQLKLKSRKVKDLLKQIANIELDVEKTIESPQNTQYRNKVQIPCKQNRNFEMGFYRLNSNDIVSFENCIVQTTISNKLYHYLKKEIADFGLENTFKHVLIKHAINSDELMIVFVSKTDVRKNIADFINRIINDFKIDSIILNVNSLNNNVILGRQDYLIYGKDKIQDILGDYKFNISAKSFYQINPYQTVNLYNEIINIAELNKNDVVVDLYSGVGTISTWIAKYVNRVIAVEIVKEAVEDAKENAINNNISNIEFINEDASIAVKNIHENYSNITSVIVDPPRKGLTKDGIETIVNINPKTIVYVSCNPATMARDIKIFDEYNFKLDKLKVFDMFPHTDHVETVALLKKI